MSWHEPSGAFFAVDGGLLVPRPHAASLWGGVLNGRTLAGLVAWAVERDHAADAYQVARLTVDMFRAAPLVPLELITSVARRGHRVRVIDVSVRGDGVELARGSAVQLRRGDAPPGTVPSGALWSPPDPDGLPEIDGPSPPWDTRRVDGPLGAQRASWVRERFAFVEGEELTPLLRAALAPDITNALANTGDRGLGYINADLTLYLSRLPVGPWLACVATGHTAAHGVAVATADLHDGIGRLGHAAMAAVADPRMIQPR